MWKVLVSLLVTGSVLSVVLSYPQQQQQAVQQRNGNPRSSRGFQIQNGKVSTARGFGKRGESQSSDLLGSPFNFDLRSYPSSWLVDELQGNPETARLVVDKFIDENGDGELSPEELLRRNYF